MYNFTMASGKVKELVFFTSHLEGNEVYYSLEVEKSLKSGPNDVDRVYFLIPYYCRDEILTWVNSEDSSIISNLKRGSEERLLNFFFFNEYAVLEEFWSNHSSVIDPIELSKRIRNIGLESLIHENFEQVFLHAPAGTVFKKPSGKTSRLFIRAAEIAVGCSQIRFVAYCLMSYRPSDLKEIYIDTSGISIYIEAMISILGSFDSKYLKLNYTSFKSYNGLNGSNFPKIPDGVWIVISASLSNDMGVKLSKIIPALHSEQILTLLSPCVYDGDRVLFDISTLDAYKALRREELPIMELEVCGENFYVPVKEPRPIVLRDVDKPSSIGFLVEKCVEGGLLSFNVFEKNKFRGYYLDFSKIKSYENLYSEYREWIKYLVNWKIPASVTSVILDLKNEASKMLLEDIEMEAYRSYEVFDFQDVSGLDRNGGVLVISPVLSTGRKYAKLNSDLRIFNHSGVRIFVAPFITFSDSNSFGIFKKSLCFGPKGRKYIFECFQEIFLGNLDNSLFKLEEEFFQTCSQGVWDDRIGELTKRMPGDTKNVGLLSNDSCQVFTTDFAFWNPGYVPSKVNPASVFWTVSAILQTVRDFNNDPNKRDRSLHHNVNQYSVLDPENFVRFNDPLIQSCLWRAAYSHELNYSTSAKLSERFFNILYVQLSEHVNGVGNSALDLLLAIALNHIILDFIHMKKLENYLNSLDSKCDRLNDLARVIFGGLDVSELEF